ncbi:MAG: 50S ribosomal protein L35ae [Candidatus Aenigmarchaeota archaeon]|nr:50S ribosomal protein L35ae [Candidatus Aenigmarchaeota archaeon]
MQGIILSYRRGRHTQNVNQVLIELENVNSREKAKEFLHRKLIWKSPAGKKIKGEVINLHGNKGVVRARFERNLPGQAITTKVEVV